MKNKLDTIATWLEKPFNIPRGIIFSVFLGLVAAGFCLGHWVGDEEGKDFQKKLCNIAKIERRIEKNIEKTQKTIDEMNRIIDLAKEKQDEKAKIQQRESEVD